MSPHVGVLALQGAVTPHLRALADLGITGVRVAQSSDIADIDALIIPGGESTTMSNLLDRTDLRSVLAARFAHGMPVLGTCAGMILLAADVADGRADQRCFGAIDVSVRRNAFGRQQDSFETDLDVKDLSHPFHAVFIRAPRVERVGDGVDVLASYHDEPVLCRTDTVLISSFHPELTNDRRVHELFLEMVP